MSGGSSDSENGKKFALSEVPTTRNKKILARRNFRRRKLKKNNPVGTSDDKNFFSGSLAELPTAKKFLFLKNVDTFQQKFFFGF